MKKSKAKIKPKKKTVVKAKKPAKKREGKLIGKISHYFSNIEVGVISLSFPLKKGDNIRIVGGQETDFEQKVGSIQIEHKEVKSAKKGDSIGIKIDEKVHQGYKVYKI